MIQVKKASGDLEPFSEEKVVRSLERTGINKVIIDRTLTHIKKELYDGISTQKIYSHIFELLRKEKPIYSARYSLKRAIMELGPTGYPFEKFIGALLKHNGYQVETGVNISGRCVTHEIDVIAQKENKHFMIECKFHNQQGIRSDVKVALYVKARFDDVEAVWEEKSGHQTKFHQAWLVTNTKFSSDAIQYGECMGMRLIGWSYPPSGSLQDLIEKSGLHPITYLTSLSRGQKEILLSSDIVLCQDILSADQTFLSSLSLSSEQRIKLFEEIKEVCGLNRRKEENK